MACKGSSVRVRSAPPISLDDGTGWTLDGMQHASRRFESDQLHQFKKRFSMADIAQLVRALVCGTKCRRFESGYPPHYKTSQLGRFLLKKFVFYDIIRIFSGRHLVVFFYYPHTRVFFYGGRKCKHQNFYKN